MKIGLIVPGGVDRSGTHRVVPFLLWLIERLARRHDVHVFALRQESRPARWTLLGAQVHNIGARPRRLRAVAAILAEHRRGPFDVLHAVWAVPQGVVGALAKRLMGVPLIVWIVGGDLVSLPDIEFGAQRNWRGRMWVRGALGAADRVVVTGPGMARDAERLGWASDQVPFGVALDRWPPCPPVRRDPGEPARLVQIADLNPVKDQETLLLAAASLASAGVDFTLDLAGVDTLGGRVQRRAAELGLGGRVRFHGSLAQPDVRALVERAHLMVVSSRAEGGLVALVEAAVTGVPTVGTAVGYVGDWSPDAAVAVPVGDAGALATAVRALLQDEDARLRLARAAYARALAWDADAMTAGFERIYREVTA